MIQRLGCVVAVSAGPGFPHALKTGEQLIDELVVRLVPLESVPPHPQEHEAKRWIVNLTSTASAG